MSAALVLHWPLDALTPESRALDTSPNRLNGQVKGETDNVPDPKFGSCLAFDTDEDQVLLADAAPLRVGPYTIELWVDAGPRPRPVGLLGKGENLSLVIGEDGSLTHQFAAGKTQESHRSDAGALPPGTWRHVAVTNDGQVARIYLDGLPAAEHAFAGGRVPDRSGLVVAASGPGVFAGRLAHLRIYDDALSAVEIARDMADDQAALDSFVRTHPLDFDFVNGDEQQVLFIDEGPGTQPMTLRLTNTSRTAISALPLTTLTNAEHHVALRFRAGTLATGLTLQPAGTDWALLAEPDGTAVYLRWKNPTTIAPGASVSVRIDGFNADGADGTHGTRVQLDYRRLQYADENAELSGTRLEFLDVVNHRGRRDIPLDLRLVGGDRILSDGQTASSLVLHLTNTLRDGPGIALRSGSAASAFVVSFDVQEENEDRPWALTDAGEASGVRLSVTQHGWAIDQHSLGQRVQWILTPSADTVLPADGYLEVRLDNVRALAQAGHAPIVVDYQNIPGYADGTLTVPVERTPLLYTQANVGVNTTPAGGATLTVGGAGATTAGGAIPHLQLRRETAPGSGGKTVYLELYQDATSDTGFTYPAIRFHHSMKFWHRIEARPEGFLLKTGDLTSDALTDLYAGIAVVSALRIGGTTAGEAELQILSKLAAGQLRIGGTTIGEAELQILKKLTAGQLQFDLYNISHGEYAYGADVSFDSTRGYVFTNRQKGRVPFGRWRLDFPG